MYQYQRNTTSLELPRDNVSRAYLLKGMCIRHSSQEFFSHGAIPRHINVTPTPPIRRHHSVRNFSRHVHFISTQNRNFWKNHLFLPMLYLSSSFCLISVRARARLLPSLSTSLLTRDLLRATSTL